MADEYITIPKWVTKIPNWFFNIFFWFVILCMVIKDPSPETIGYVILAILGYIAICLWVRFRKKR